MAELVVLAAVGVAIVVLGAVENGIDFEPKKGFGWAWRTHNSQSAIFCTFGRLLLKGTMIRLAQRQKVNTSNILGVAYIARHGLVKNTREGRKER